jgi:cyanophycinase
MVPGPPRPLRRRLLVIGGTEDLTGPTTVLRRFVRLAGGPDARIAVVQALAQCPDLGDADDHSADDAEAVLRCRDALSRLGAGQVLTVRTGGRSDPDDAGWATLIGDVTAALVLGGDRPDATGPAVLAGSALGEAISSAYRRGAVVAGTWVAAGLGLLPEVLVDQRFDRGSGHGRLLALVARSPDLIGLGVEKNTAALVTEGRDMEVIGDGSAYVVDASAAVTDAGEPAPGQPLLVSGAVVHSLPAGTKFDLTQRASATLAHRRAGRPVDRVASKR